MAHEPARFMPRIRRFFSRLFTWPFFVGIGTGIALMIGGFSLMTFFMVQQLEDRAGDSGGSVASPEISDRADQSVHGTVPDDWTIQPVSNGADSTAFGKATGTTTVVNLWATWCGPCVEEMPTLEALHTSTGDSVSVVLVSGEEKSTVRQFWEDRDYSMPVYVTSELPTVFQGEAIPRTFILDADGRVRYRHVGAADWNADAVHRLLQQIPKGDS